MNKFRNIKFISLVCILAFALVFIGFHFLQAQGKPDKDKPPGKVKPAPELLLFEPPNIVTTESNALRVWNCALGPSDSMNPIWSTKIPGYNSVAVGDVDGDNLKEIVVPEIKEIRKKGGNAPCAGPFKIFLNVYKEGQSDIWESTEGYGKGLGGGYVEDPARFAEVVIDDVDQDGVDEVILRTANYLAIFKYIAGKLQIASWINVSDLKLDIKAIFYAVTTGDIPKDSGGYEDKEIIVFVKEWTENFDEGWIFIFDKDLTSWDEIIAIPSIRGGESLRVADLDGDTSPEICLTGSRESLDTGWQPYVFVWDFYINAWNPSEVYIPNWDINATNTTPYVGLDVGELYGNSTNGEEIVVYSNLPNTSDYQLIIYKYDHTNGIFMPSCPVQVQAHISNVEIGDVVNDNSGRNEIIAAGRAKLGAQGVFYLEVFGSSLDSLWQRVGERKEGMVFDTAIVEK